MSKPTSPLRALIVDDESPARRRLRKLVNAAADEGAVAIVGEAADGVEALDMLEKLEVDLAFLDIQMPELNGFDVLERLARDARPVVIFTTAYDSYALRAFEANAIDYLLKPISKDRLGEAIERAHRAVDRGERRRIDDQKLDKLLEWIDAQEAEQESEPETEHVRQLSVPYRDRILLIPVEQVISAEINEGITRIFALESGEKAAKVRQHVVNYTLDQLEMMLPSDRFMRVHRSSIVHIDHIRELIPWFSGRYKLLMPGDHEVIASRERSKNLKDILMI